MKDNTKASKRAAMPSGAAAVLEERTLHASNANLLHVLEKGQRVLDVGCGSGAITQGMAAVVGEEGHVDGIDRSQELIDLAKVKYGHLVNVGFICGDILDYSLSLPYDIVTTARTLQWIEDPVRVIRKMIGLLPPGGLLCVLDYNHTLIHWDPAPPASMRHFYDRFLQWRADAGMDNAIGDHMPQLLEAEKMLIVCFEDRSEFCRREEPGFDTHIGIWSQVARLRGPQLVADGYLTEEERLTAIDEYADWATHTAQSMRLSLRATHGRLVKGRPL